MTHRGKVKFAGMVLAAVAAANGCAAPAATSPPQAAQHAPAAGSRGQTVTAGPGGNYRTIAAAVGKSEAERDHIVLLDGTHTSKQITIGGDERYITIRAKTPGKVKVKLSGARLIRADNTHHITIADLHCTGGTNFGWFFFCHHIVLDGVRYTGGQHGVRFMTPPGRPPGGGGHSHIIRNCWFCDNGEDPDGGHSGILIGNTSATSWAQRTLVEHCTLNGNGEDGIQPTAPTKFHVGMPTAAYIEIRHCVMKGNGENAVDLKACRYVRVHHNIMVKNGGPGIVVHSPENSGNTTGPHHCAVYNNLIADNGGQGYAQPDGDVAQKSHNLIFNNIVVRNGRTGIWTGRFRTNKGDRIFNNTVVNNRGSRTTLYHGGWGIGVTGNHDNRVIANVVFGNRLPGFHAKDEGIKLGNVADGPVLRDNLHTDDPRFVNPKADDYHLAAGSPVLSHRYKGRIFTPEEVKKYKKLLGKDLPINEYGPAVYYDDVPRAGALVPGALGPKVKK